MHVDLYRLVCRACLLFLALRCLAAPAVAQTPTGAVAGVVVDAETGESLIGANVIIEGTSIGSTTDLSGRYEIRGLDPGTYDVVYSYIGYQGKTVQNVVVTAGETKRIDLSLAPETMGLGEVYVEAEAVENTEAALLAQRAKADAVSDAISAEAISRSGAGDASAAMSKVTGASVVGGKYVYIRGLGERYSSTQLNGAELPSADPDKKAFQLDLFPASLLDNIVTLKTFTPDKPGSFSGGLVNVGTKHFPDRLTLQVGFSSSYNTQTTFSDEVLTYSGGEAGWLGFNHDLGLPALLDDPSVEIPTTPTVEILARRDPEKAALLDEIARAFDPVMYTTRRTAPVNRSLSLAFGNQIDLAGRPLGFTASLTYGQHHSSYDNGRVGRYELVGGSVADIEALTPLRRFGGEQGVDLKGSQETDLGGLATLAFKPHPNHELSATYLHTASAVSEARFLSGYWVDIPTSTFQTRVLGYKERLLQSLQFRGEHFIEGLTLEWNGSAARNTQEEPDLRYFSNHYNVTEGDTLYSSPASLYPAPTRFFRDLEEQNLNAGLDLSIPFRPWNGLSSKLQIGAAYLDVDRDFEERRFEYREGNGISYQQFGGDDAAYFRAVGVVDTSSSGRFSFGNYLIEVSPLRNNYDAVQQVMAGYGMLDLSLTRRLRFVGGVRYETTEMRTVSADTTLPRGELDNRDWLPSANFVYSLTDNMNLRAAATRTLARPTFRELAPYSTFDFVGDFVFSGNAQLERTLITNYDLRWEWFVRPGEILAASTFYKRFEDPIERVILTSVGNNSLSVQNVDEATVYGVELEARKRLDDVAGLLRNFQVGGNLTLVQSEVSIPQAELDVIRAADPDAATSRRLQGQSPYLVNLDVTYDNYETGTAVGLYYNLFGERLSTVSEGAAPDIFERARTMVDLVASQKVFSYFTLKFSAKNLLNAPVRFSQRFKGQAFIYQEYETGRVFSLGVSYTVD